MKNFSFIIPGRPLAFARAGRGGGFTFTPKPQRDYMTLVKHEAWRAMAGYVPLGGPISLSITFYYIVPQSWSRRKTEAAIWKVSAPDVDNLAKIVKDSLSKIVFRDDAQVAKLYVQKRYGEREMTLIEVEEL